MSEPKKKALTIHDLTVKVGEYKTIHEGDPEMKEDPEFPLHLMHEAIDNNNTIDGNAVKGTFVYYPNKNKPKMWIGNYKILNPEDILSKDVAAKIGMTEAQWKKYIENKKNGTSLQDGYGDFDCLTDDQKELLSKHLISGTTLGSYDEYANEIEFKGSVLNTKRFHDMELYEQMHHKDQQQLSHGYAQKPIKASPEQPYDEKNMEGNRDFVAYDQQIYTNDMLEDVYDQTEYIKRLNEEAARIRQEQEEEIYQQQKDLMYYSSVSMGNGTEVTKMSNVMLPQAIVSPIEYFDENEFEYAEDEVADYDEQIQLGNYSNQMSQLRREGDSIEEKETEETEDGEQEVNTSTEQWQKQKLSGKKELVQGIQQKKIGKEKDVPVKAKVNSFSKNPGSSRVSIITKRNPYKSVKSLGTMSTKSSIGVNQSKIITANRNKNLKNAKLKKAVV